MTDLDAVAVVAGLLLCMSLLLISARWRGQAEDNTGAQATAENTAPGGR